MSNDTATPAAITDTERDAAAAVARPWLNAVARAAGVYPVTVGGYVIGHVERHAVATSKTALWWSVTDADGKRTTGAFHSRADAVDVLGRTDHAVLCYRDAARLGVFGVVEQARQRSEDAAGQEPAAAKDMGLRCTFCGGSVSLEEDWSWGGSDPAYMLVCDTGSACGATWTSGGEVQREGKAKA